MTKKILTSSQSKNFKLIQENQESKKKYMVRGILQRADTKNQNGRIYPYAILKKEVDRYANIFIKEKRAYGELDHPDSSIVEAKNASHVVTKVWWEGKDLWGDIEVLDTPSGDIVKKIIDSGNALGISSRGLGTEIEMREGTVRVDEDFELIAWDFVTNPSVQGAFMRYLQESKESAIESKFLYNEINTKISNILRSL